MEIMEAIASRQGLGLSVIIITKNEAARLAECLASVRFADEIIVLDGCSVDGTADIARAHGAQVHEVADWPGFGPQKNRVLALATQPWVLSIDADERVTPELQAEIIQTLAQPEYDGYRIARLSEFCGKQIRHSGWWPDYVLRLFRRELSAFDNVNVHEQVLVNGRVGDLKSWFLHFPFENLDALVVKINRYSGDAPNELKRAQVADCGMASQVSFPGLVDDVRPWLAACDVGYVLSYQEALSFACRELMALGLPVLVTRVGGLPENVTDGQEGWIVPPRSPELIKVILQKILSQPQQLLQMGACARARAEREFGLPAFVQATLAAYQLE